MFALLTMKKETTTPKTMLPDNLIQNILIYLAID